MARRSPVSSDRRFKKNTHAQENRPDHGPAERWQHGQRNFVFTERAGVFAARALVETALEKLCRRQVIDAISLLAGQRLAADFMKARLSAKTTLSYGQMQQKHLKGTARVVERSQAAEMAYQRWRSALLACPAEARDVLVNLCCLDILPTELLAAEINLSEMSLAEKGLTSLVQHYGLRKQGQGGGKIRVALCGTRAE